MEQYCQNGVVYLRSSLIPCPHGFSTRIGGISPHAHTASLNLAFGRGDDREVVLKNLERFSSAVGVDPHSVVSPPQVHGKEILYCTEKERGYGYYSESTPYSADGTYTDQPGVTLGVKTADCVPILLCGCDAAGLPVAVMALHAGWRGTLAGIAFCGVEHLYAMGISPTSIFAAIGPSIGRCCYEVDSVFKNAFDERLDSKMLDGIFRASEENPGHYYCDLKEINRRILRDTGIPEQNIDVCDFCTACTPELFYSHRASNGVRGTMLSVIALPTPQKSGS